MRRAGGLRVRLRGTQRIPRIEGLLQPVQEHLGALPGGDVLGLQDGEDAARVQ
jgi:hypothetical protein